MNYQDKYALRPVWFIRISTTVFMTSMGFVNCIVFMAREKPWKSILTSDGTFWGSFAVWRSRNGVSRVNSLIGGVGNARLNSQGGNAEGGGLGRGNRTSAGSSEQARRDMGQARMRLELEKEERLMAIKKRVASGGGISDDDSGKEGGNGGSDAGKGGAAVDSASGICEKGKGKGKARVVDV